MIGSCWLKEWGGVCVALFCYDHDMMCRDTVYIAKEKCNKNRHH